MSDRALRLLPLAGIVGPAGFIGAWATSGALTAGYSSVQEAISELARVGAPARAVMTGGFVCFGVAVPTYAVVLRRTLGGPAWVTAAISGVATLGIALFPLGRSSTTDGVHNALAALGYLSLVATPALTVRPLVEAGHCRAAALSVATAGVAAGCLATTLVGPAHGLFQRSGLTTVDLWLMAGALAVARRDQAHRSASS